MEEYYFLFVLAIAYIIFATIQDLRKNEVANWLNFTLVAFVLIYRLIYSVNTGNYNFFLLGCCGFLIFFIFGNILYYTKVFGGGDVKLLMGIGAMLPFFIYRDLIFTSVLFLAILFLGGAVYSLAYSLYLVFKNGPSFRKEFSKQLKTRRILLVWVAVIAILFFITGLFFGNELFGKYDFIWNYEAVFILVLGILFVYLKSIENSCLIKEVSPSNLMEGDWLEKSVRVGSRVIKKTVYGLSKNDIRLLKKAKKKVIIRYGVPFVPAFLIAMIFTVLALAVLRFDLEAFLSSLF